MTENDLPLKIRAGLIRIASFRDEWDLDLREPQAFIDGIRRRLPPNADIFTFIQRPPDVTPRYDHFYEWERVAVLEYRDHKYWFEKILDGKTRNMIRKADKKGVTTRIADFDDEFITGIVGIYNEDPIRQGRKFAHFGKTFEEARATNATHLERSQFIGAYYGTELIGFIKLVFGDRTARAEQIIAKVKHRDKAPVNALFDMAVRLSEQRGVPYIIYGTWPLKESLAHFKKNNGFKRVDVPRYYVPITFKGRLGLALKLYRGPKALIPDSLRLRLTALRESWYDRQKKRLEKN